MHTLFFLPFMRLPVSTFSDVQLFIGGSWRKTAQTQPIINPADEAVIGSMAVAERADLDDALEAAESGFKIWSAPRRRAAPKSSSPQRG